MIRKQMTDVEWQKIYEMSQDRNLYQNIISSLFPTIHGQYTTRTLSILQGDSVYYHDTQYTTMTLSILPGHSVYHDTQYTNRTLSILPGYSFWIPIECTIYF